MTNDEKIKELRKLNKEHGSTETFSRTLDKIGDIRYDYSKFMKTHPIDLDKEMERAGGADYDTLCALLTAAIREAAFCGDGAFAEKIKNGDIQRILTRMINLLEHDRDGI